jgi:hypothetical protein
MTLKCQKLYEGILSTNFTLLPFGYGVGSENPVMTSANVEIVIPQAYLGHVYGENCSNLNYIKQVCCR